MTERPLCRDVSLQAARECLTDALSYAAAAALELRDAAGHALIALAQGPTMRAVERPMPPPSAEAEARWAQMLAQGIPLYDPHHSSLCSCHACRRWMQERPRDEADVVRRAHEAMAQRDALSAEPVCICGDYPVAVGEPCAACAEHVS